MGSIVSIVSIENIASIKCITTNVFWLDVKIKELYHLRMRW